MPGIPSGRDLSSVRKSVGDPCSTVASRASSARSSGAGEKLESTRIDSAPAATALWQTRETKGMRDRNNQRAAVVRTKCKRLREKVGAFDLANVLDKHAFREAGCPRGVQDGRDIPIERSRFGHVLRKSGSDPKYGPVGTQNGAHGCRDDARQHLGERVAAVGRDRDDHHRLRVRQHQLELPLAQARAQRDGDGSEAPGREQPGHELRRVRRDERDPLAAQVADGSDLLLDPRRELAQLGVGQEPIARGERRTVGRRLLEEARDQLGLVEALTR